MQTAVIHNGWTAIFRESLIAATRLLAFRLRWYALGTARILLRRWQALALIVGLLAAAGATVFDNLAMFSRPILEVVAPGHGFGRRLAHLLAVQLFAALWAHMQREQIMGGEFMAFAGSLPFSARQRRRVDLAVLLLADSPLLLALAAAGTVAMAPRGAGHLLVLADAALLALLGQLAVLERRLSAGIAMLAASVPLAALFGTRLEQTGCLLLGLGAVLALRRTAWARWRLPSIHAARPAPDAQSGRPQSGRILRRLAGRHAPALRLSLAILLRERRNEVLAKTLLAGLVLAAAAGLARVFDDAPRSFGVAMIAQALVALTLSGLYRGLDMAHRASLGLTGALPLPRAWWRPFDLAAVAGFGLPFLLVPALLAGMAGAAPTRVLAALLSACVLLCCLRAPILFNERHATVLSTILAGAWCAATLACLI